MIMYFVSRPRRIWIKLVKDEERKNSRMMFRCPA